MGIQPLLVLYKDSVLVNETHSSVTFMILLED